MLYTLQTTHNGNARRQANAMRLLDSSIFADQTASSEQGDPAFDFSFSSFPVIASLANVDFGEVVAAWRRAEES